MELSINKHFKTHIKNYRYLTPSYKIETKLSFSNIKPPYKYIFFRLYDVDYYNHLKPASLLKFGVDTTEIYDIHASHVSINFSLEDNFYGLTSGGKYQLAQEYCTNNGANKFTKQCNPETSNQSTYALRVSESEYYKLKSFVEDYASSTKTRFDVLQDFKIAKFATIRKFFTEKDEQLFGNVVYPEEKMRNLIKKVSKSEKKENRFICSTFIAYALINNVPRIKRWFKKYHINYRYVNVTDVVNIPGTSLLFTSKFNEYIKASKEFTLMHEEFSQYL